MALKKWEKIPSFMQNEKVYTYYKKLHKRKISLVIKRIFDIIASLVMLILFLPIISILSLIIILDSRGGIFFRQIRVTRFGKRFKIIKFRTMRSEPTGSLITLEDDSRITRVGKFLRKYRLDEIPQLINILAGEMSFVGVRPEVEKYVEIYSDEMLATLLLPAGVTSETSIFYKNEQRML